MYIGSIARVSRGVYIGSIRSPVGGRCTGVAVGVAWMCITAQGYTVLTETVEPQQLKLRRVPPYLSTVECSRLSQKQTTVDIFCRLHLRFLAVGTMARSRQSTHDTRQLQPTVVSSGPITLRFHRPVILPKRRPILGKMEASREAPRPSSASLFSKVNAPRRMPPGSDLPVLRPARPTFWAAPLSPPPCLPSGWRPPAASRRHSWARRG